MKEKDLNFNPVILFTDAEKANKIGAVTFINQLSDNEKENILTVITADMVAYGLNYETWNINEEYRDSIYNRRVRDKAEEMNINLIQYAEDKNYSDYYIFETNGIGTVSFGMEDYEKWYTENDSIDIINTEDLKVMTTLINEVILEVQKISVDQSN